MWLEKLTLTLNFKVESFVALYSTHREDKTFTRNHGSQSNGSLEKWQKSFFICVLTATLLFYYVIFIFLIINN